MANTLSDHLLTLQCGERFIDVRKVAFWCIEPADFLADGKYTICGYTTLTAKGEPIVAASYSVRKDSVVELQCLIDALRMNGASEHIFAPDPPAKNVPAYLAQTAKPAAWSCPWCGAREPRMYNHAPTGESVCEKCSEGEEPEIERLRRIARDVIAEPGFGEPTAYSDAMCISFGYTPEGDPIQK